MLLVLTVFSGFSAVISEPLEDDGSLSEKGTARTLAGIAPYIRSAPFEPYPVTSAEPTDFSFFVRDNDSASLNLTWDWGDGVVEITNVTFTPATNVRINRSHIYYPVPEPGRGGYNVNYNFNLTIMDPDLNWDYDITVVSCLVNVTNSSPSNLSLSINLPKVDPSDNVLIAASAMDPEGEALTWTFMFYDNDSVVYRTLVSHTPATTPGQTVWNNLTHVFGTEGQHRIFMNISDALPPYQIWPHNVSTSLGVIVEINVPPGVGSGVIDTIPTSLIINSTLGYGLMTYKVQALDIDGDILTVTWNFGDGTPEVVNVSAGGTATYTFVQVRNYTDAGIFNVTVNITDGRPGHESSLYKVVTIQSTNLPPVLINAAPQYPGDLTYAKPNQTVNFTLVLQDPESDAVSVMIDFGDGSPKLFANLTEFVDGNATLLFTHVYVKVGNYTVLINYTDNKIGKFEHNKNVTVEVDIYIPYIEPPVIWNAWDYISLGLFCMIPVLIAVRMILIGRRRKELEREGISLEEWKLMTSEMGSQDRKRP